MIQEVMATYFKWGQRKNHILITFLLCVAMIVSLSWQVFDSYETFKTGQEIKLEPQYEITTTTKTLTINDFELLFGFNNKSEEASKSAEIPKTKLNLVLRGSLADIGSNNGDSSAIIQDSNQDKLYSEGDALPGGVTLKAINADHVILSRNGQLEKLFFPGAGKDSRALQEYRNQGVEDPGQLIYNPEFTQQPDDKSLEQRMQELREKLQQANQGIQ